MSALSISAAFDAERNRFAGGGCGGGGVRGESTIFAGVGRLCVRRGARVERNARRMLEFA